MEYISLQPMRNLPLTQFADESPTATSPQMLMARAVVLFVSMVAASSQVLVLLESLNPGKARRLEDVSYEMLQNHSIIVLAEENSILTSDFQFGHNSLEYVAPATNDTDSDEEEEAFENLYVHMEYLPDSVSIQESEPVNVNGCFDNRYSSTVSQVAKTYGTNFIKAVGPRAYIKFLGFRLGFSVKLVYDATREEKLTCAVGAGERLQLQVTTTTTKLHFKRQRILRFDEDGGFSNKYESSPWQTLDNRHALEFSANVMTCSTDEKYLSC